MGNYAAKITVIVIAVVELSTFSRLDYEIRYGKK